MTPPLHLLLVAGARPNFMKVAPLIHQIRRPDNGARGLSYTLVHTGQHYDPAMSGRFFDELDIPPPHRHLGVGSDTHARQTARLLTEFEPLLQEEQPDWLIVVGDVNSTLAATLAAAKLGIRIAHVEAGLRSRDRSMPEEVNRLVTDALSDLHLTPSEDADENLRRENVPSHRIRRVGNIMIDSLIQHLPRARTSPLPRTLGLNGDPFAYVTLHRPANVDHPAKLARILHDLDRIGHRLPVLFPLHPRTRARMETFGLRSEDHPHLRLLEPVGYFDSLWLTEHARLVLTDSGGLQEETTFFRTPCLTLRPNTERPVTLTRGSNRLTRIEHLLDDVEDLLNAPPRLGSVPPLWDGQAASRILQALREVSTLRPPLPLAV